jgi:hypothetical protein
LALSGGLQTHELLACAFQEPIDIEPGRHPGCRRGHRRTRARQGCRGGFAEIAIVRPGDLG